VTLLKNPRVWSSAIRTMTKPRSKSTESRRELVRTGGPTACIVVIMVEELVSSPQIPPADFCTARAVSDSEHDKHAEAG